LQSWFASIEHDDGDLRECPESKPEADARGPRKNEIVTRDKRDAKHAYGALYLEVRGILNAHDPVGLISMGAPEDEYEPEVGTILPRLKEASDPSGVQVILQDEFVRWFGGVGMFTFEEFAPVAEEVWASWSRFGQDRC
jgi:hypothetical protein